VIALLGLLLLGLLYWKPLHTYLHTRHELQQRQAQVGRLLAEQRLLRHQVANAGTPTALLQEARCLGLVKPNERLFIVEGIHTSCHNQ
jgi:hypothetical protein